MARRLRAALGLVLLASSGWLAAGQTSPTYIRFFGPIAPGCAITGTGLTSLTTADDSTNGPGFKAVDNSAAVAVTVATGQTLTGTDSCVDTFTGLNFPFSLGGEVTSGATGTQVNAVANIAKNKGATATAAIAYQDLKNAATWTSFEGASVYTTMAGGSALDGKKILVTDLQFIALVQATAAAYLAANSNAYPTSGTCKTIDDLVTQLSKAIDATHADTTKVVLTTAADVVTVINLAIGDASYCNMASWTALTGSENVVKSVVYLATYANTLGNTADNTYSIQDIAFMAGFSAYLSGFTTASPMPIATIGAYADVATASAAFKTSVTAALVANVGDAQILAILNALNLKVNSADYSKASWNTTVRATNAGPLSGATLTYTPFNRMSGSTTAATDSTSGVLVSGATLGLYTIPVGAKDLLLDSTGNVATSAPFTGIAPMPDQSLATGASYSIYMGPINALIWAQYQDARTNDGGISLPLAASDWQNAYETILGTSGPSAPASLPNGNYLTRVLDSGAEWQGTKAALAVYIADIMLSNTVTLASVFLNALKTQSGATIDGISAKMFAQLITATSTELTDSASLQTYMENIFSNNYLTGAVFDSSRATDLGVMTAAIANVNSLAFGYLPASLSDDIMTARPAPSDWMELTQLARLVQKDMVAAFTTYGGKWKTGQSTFQANSGPATDITTPYTNLITSGVQAVTGVNKALLATVYTPALGYARFFGPVSAGCAVTYDDGTIAQPATTLGMDAVIDYKTVSIAPSATCVDTFTGAAFPYPAVGYSNFRFQISSTTTVASQETATADRTAAKAYATVGLVTPATSSAGVDASSFPGSPYWEYKSVFDNMASGYTVLAKRQLATDLQFLAASAAFISATSGYTFSTNCGTIPKLQLALAKSAVSQAPLDLTATADITKLFTHAQDTCTSTELTNAMVTAITTSDVLAAVQKLTQLANTLASPGTNKWVVNDLAAMAHYAAYLSGTIDLAGVKAATSAALLTSVGGTTIVPSAIATTLFGTNGYTTKDTAVTAYSVGPVSGAQLSYQSFDAMSASPLVDTNKAALTTDLTGTVTVPSATHGLYTIPAGATDMFLNTDGQAVTTWVPITGVATFPSVGATPAKDVINFSPMSGIVWSKFKYEQNKAAWNDNTPTPTTPAASEWQDAYEAILTPTSLPSGNYYTRKFDSGTYAGSNAALAVFAADLLVSNIATLGGLYINNVLGSSATNTIDLILGNLYDQMAAPGASPASDTPATATQLSTSSDINAYLTLAWTAANGGTAPVASSKDESALSFIADTIAGVNLKVKTDILAVAAAATLNADASGDLWIEAVQIAKVVNYNMAPLVKSAAATIKAASTWASVSAAVTASVQTPYAAANSKLDNAVSAAVLNLTAVAQVVGPLRGYTRFFGPVADSCKVMFSHTTQPQWTYDGAVIAIQSETVTVNYNSSYPCKDTFTGKSVPFPVSGWAPAGNGAGDFFQVSAVNSIAGQKGSVSTAYASYTALGLPGTDADGGIATADWTANRKWETANVWANLQSTSTAVRGAKRLLALDLQFIALSVASAAAIQGADTSSQLKTGCKTVAELQAALAKYAGGTTLQMDTAAHIGTILSGIQSTCGNTNFPPAVLTAANVGATQSAILRLVTVGAQLANTGDNGWVLYDIINMVRFASYVSDAVSLSSDAATHTAAVAAASIDINAITAELNINYAEKDTRVTVLGLGVLNGTTLSYQRFYDMNATDLAMPTDEMGLVEVVNATHALYTIPAGMVDTLLTNDTASPVLTLVPWTGVSGFTGATGRIVINPAAALVYARMRASGTLNVPSAGTWTTMYQNLMGTGVTLPARDYQSRADETLLGSYASLAVLAADVILQSTPALGGLFITNAVGGNATIDKTVKKILDEVYDADATELSTGSYVLSALTAVWTDVAGAAPTTNQTAVLTSISNAIAASNAAANAVLAVAVTKFSTNTMQDFATWKSVVQVAKVQNDMALPILTIAAAVHANSTSVVQDVVKMVETPYTGTNLTAAVAAAAVNDDAVRHAAGLGRTANARFFGPLAAGCTVAYAVTTTPTTSMLGEVTATAMEQLTVAKCQDTFTGKTTPWDVIGYSLDQFQLSATTSISAKHSTGTMDHTSRFAYGQLGITANDVNVTDWYKDRKLESADLMQLFAMGDITVPKKLLQKDLGFMALSAGVVSAVISADTTGSLKTGCKTASELQQALSKYIANLADGSPAAQVDLGVDTPATVVSAAFTGLQSVCSTGNVSAAIPTAVLSAAASTANVAAITALVNSAFLLEDNSQWPLWQMASFAHLASYMSDALVLSGADFKTEDNLGAAINASTINPEGICAAMGVEGYAAHDLDVVPAFAGPLSGVNASYLAFTQIVESNMADDNGLLHIPGATHAIYTFNAGAVFTFLTTDATKPVKTLVPITGITGFPGPGARTTVGPINSLVWQMFEQGEGKPVAVPDPSMWKHAYETLVGAALPPNDYHTRNYTKDSATGLAVFAIDMVLPALPTLGSLLINASLPQTSVELGIDLEMVLRALYEGLIDASLKDLSDADKVTLILLDVYTTLTGVEVTTNSTARRVLLDTGATMSAILSNIGAALADSNAMAGDVLKTAMAAIANGTAVDPSLFTQLVKIASVQNVNLAAAVQDIASKIAAGQLDAALNASAVAKDAYTGTNLMAAVAAAKVNDAAISAALLPDPGTPGAATTTSSSSSSSSSKTLAIGLGVGLGVGIPLVVGIGAAVFMSIKKRRAMQTTTPAPPA